MGQGIRRIVRGADRFDGKPAEYPLRAQLRRFERIIRALPYAAGASLIQQLVDAEVPLQLEVRPVIKGIAQRLGYCLRPREELVVRRRIARAKTFRDAAGAHRAPLVMIAFEPDFEQVREPAIVGDVFRGQMAVIVEDWLALGVGVKQPARGSRLEKEVVVYVTH